MSKKDELWRLMEETAVKEPNSYKLFSGLEHPDIGFPLPEGTGSNPCEDDFDVSTCEDIKTISNCRDCWRWWWCWQRCYVLQIGKQLASDFGEFWAVFDEMSFTQSPSAPPSPKIDCAKSDSESSYEPYPTVPPSTASTSSNSKSTRSPSPFGSPVNAPKQNCPKVNILARSSNKEVFNKDVKNNQGQQRNEVRYWVTDV